MKMTMGKDIDAKQFVDTQGELAEQLGISVRTIARMMKLATHPGKTPEGKYDVTEWERFREEYNENVTAATSFPKEIKEEIAKVRLRKEIAQADREELLLLKLKKEVVPIDEIKESWTLWYAKLTGIIRSTLMNIQEISVPKAERLFNEILDQVNAATVEFSGHSSDEEE